MKINIINLQYNFILLILYTKINQMITIIIIIHILTFLIKYCIVTISVIIIVIE